MRREGRVRATAVRVAACVLVSWMAGGAVALAQTAQEHYARGLALAGEQRHQDALAEYLRALALDPGYAPARREVGYARHALKDYRGSLGDFDRYLELAPTDADAYNTRCWLKIELGDLDGALSDCNLSLSFDPGGSMALVNRGRIHSRRGDLRAAIVDYSAAIELNPRDHMAYRNRGIQHKALGDLDAAQRDFEKALEVNPGYTRARESLEQLKAERARAAGSTALPVPPPALPPPPTLEPGESPGRSRVQAVETTRTPTPALPPPPALGPPPGLPERATQAASDSSALTRPSDDPGRVGRRDESSALPGTEAESSALAHVRTVLSAQASFELLNGGFAAEVRCLASPAGCAGVQDPGVPYVDAAFAESERLGYRFQLHPGGMATGAIDRSGAVAITALPIDGGLAMRSFCGHVTATGESVVCSLPAGRTPLVERGKCPAACLPVP